MTNTIFHGTTVENSIDILKNGFCSESLLWHCSNDCKTYFHNATKVEEYDTDEENLLYAKEEAAQSARIAAALQNSKYDSVCVFEISIDADMLEDDDSCENMSYCSQIDSIDLNAAIADGTARIWAVHYFRYYSSLRLFYLTGLRSNRYINIGDFLANIELEALSMMPGDFFIEDLMHCEEVAAPV